MKENRKKLSKHVLSKHSGVHHGDVTSTSNLPSQFLDPAEANGVFAVVKTMHGSSVLFHKQRKEEAYEVYCESPQCQSNHELAQRSSVIFFQIVSGLLYIYSGKRKHEGRCFVGDARK